jgi:hypothetical protein
MAEGKFAGGQALESASHGLGPGEGGGLQPAELQRIAQQRLRLAHRRQDEEAMHRGVQERRRAREERWLAKEAAASLRQQQEQERDERELAQRLESVRRLKETGDLNVYGNRRDKKYLLTVPTASDEAAAQVAAQLHAGDVPPLERQGQDSLSSALYLPRRSFGEHLPAGWAGLALKITKEPLDSEERRVAFKRLAELSTEFGVARIGPRIFANGVFGSQSSLPGELKNRGWTLEQRYATDLKSLLTRRDNYGMKFASFRHETSLVQAAMEGALERLRQVAKLGYLPGDVKPENLLARLSSDEDSPALLEVRMTDYDINFFMPWPGPVIRSARQACHSENDALRALSTASTFVSAVLLQRVLLARAAPGNLNGMAAEQLEQALGKPRLVPEVVHVLLANRVVQKNLRVYSRKGVRLGPAAAAAEQLLPYTPALDCSDVEIAESSRGGPHRKVVYNRDEVDAAWKAASEAEAAARKRHAPVPPFDQFHRASDIGAHMARMSSSLVSPLVHALERAHSERLRQAQVETADRERAEQADRAEAEATAKELSRPFDYRRLLRRQRREREDRLLMPPPRDIRSVRQRREEEAVGARVYRSPPRGA